jgi:hypothetical protein
MKKSKNLWPYLFFLLATFLFFWKVFLKGLVPIPADLIVGIYHPWRDHIWPGFPAGVPFKNGLLSDIVSIIYPWRIYAVKLMKAGQWPLWLPTALSGQPLLANFQSAVFYPLNFLFFLFSEVSAWTIYIILQPILASFFAFLFLREIKLSKLSSIFGALIFAFSGFNLVWLEYGIVGHSGLWLPLILWVTEKLAKKFNPWVFLIGVGAVGFSLLAGYPQVSLYVLGVASLYAIFTKKKKRFVFLFLALGIGLAAVQLIPGQELLKLSIRSEDITTTAFDQGFASPKHLLLFFFPDFFGNNSTQNFFGSLPYNESAGFIGLTGLTFALWAFFARKKSRFFKIGFLLSLLLLFRFPGQFLAKLPLPGLKSASSGRLFFLVDFFLAVLASFGLEEFLKRKKLGSLKVVIALLILFYLSVWTGILLQIRSAESQVLLNLEVTKRNLIFPTLSLLAASFLIFLSKFWPKKKNWLSFFLVCLAVFELFRFGWKYLSFSRREWLYPETSLTSFLQKEAGLDRFVGLIPQGMSIPYNLASPEGYEPLMIRDYALLANQINEPSFREPSPGSRWVKVHNFDSKLLDLLGTRFFLADQDWFLGKRQGEMEIVFEFGRSRVFENRQSFPRAFLSHQYEVIKDKRETLQRLTDKFFNPREIVLLKEAPLEKIGTSPGEPETVTLKPNTYWQNQPVFEVDARSPGLLFFSDNFYPGWQAFVDDRPAKLYQADLTFRAVPVPEGQHQVRFVYQPKSFKIGLIISFLSLIFSWLLAWQLKHD